MSHVIDAQAQSSGSPAQVWALLADASRWDRWGAWSKVEVDGMKVENYRSTVTLEPAAGGGTTVRWHSEYEKAGRLTAVILRGAVRDACRRVAKAASATPAT